MILFNFVLTILKKKSIIRTIKINIMTTTTTTLIRKRFKLLQNKQRMLFMFQMIKLLIKLLHLLTNKFKLIYLKNHPYSQTPSKNKLYNRNNKSNLNKNRMIIMFKITNLMILQLFPIIVVNLILTKKRLQRNLWEIYMTVL